MNSGSKKQSGLNAAEHKIKREMLRKQLDEHGYTFCQKCGRHWDILHLAHVTSRAQGGARAARENLALWCRECHFPNGVHYSERGRDATSINEYR